MTTTPQTITNLGTGGTDLNATNGSTSGADSNDSKFLDWPGDNRGSYIYLPGLASNLLSVPDDAAYAVTDLDIRLRVALDDWTPAANSTLMSQAATSSDFAYDFRVLTTGFLNLRFTSDGTTIVSKSSTAATGFTDGQAYWVRCVLDVDNGASGYDVKFYWAADSADEPTSWTQLGTTVTTATATSLFNSTQVVRVGQVSTTGQPLAAAIYRAIVKSGIDGTSLLDIDTSVITSGSATSFTAAVAPATGGASTVTIGRATTGRKTVAVVSPVHLFGTDDYWEVTDNALLDFTSSQSFTIVAVIRTWATLATNDAMVAKKADTTATTLGWALTAGSSTAAQGQLQAGDGTNGATAVSDSRTAGVLSVVAGVRNVSADTITTYLNGTAGTPVTDTTTATLANSSTVRIGRLSGAGTEYSDFELLAVAVFRRALSASEISSITSYYQARLS